MLHGCYNLFVTYVKTVMTFYKVEYIRVDIDRICL